MANLPHGLTKKLGPLPVWAWALVIIGGYFAATKLRASRASAASPAAPSDTGAPIDSGSGVGPGAGGGGVVTPIGDPVAGGQPPAAQSADYTGLLSQAIDTIGGQSSTLGDVADSAVSALDDSNVALTGGLVDVEKGILHRKIDIHVKVPTDKKGHRTLAPHHAVSDHTKPDGILHRKDHIPSHKQALATEKPHPQSKDAVRPEHHTVASGQGSKPAQHSPAIHHNKNHL